MSNLKLEDGFYWAEPKKHIKDVFHLDDLEVIKVEKEKSYIGGFSDTFFTNDFNFDPNPQPIPKPEWCK